MKQVIFSPYSRPLRNGKLNPKNYPWWSELVGLLVADGWEVIQVGREGEPRIPGVTTYCFGLPLREVTNVIAKATTFCSVDNFLPHMVACELKNKRGVVLWGKSDPVVFGYPSNNNLLKDRRYLRTQQFGLWEDEAFDPQVFVEPEVVLAALQEIQATADETPR
jgi:hypothetical protein